MRALSELDLIHAWEQGLRLAPAERPLALLAVACPDAGREQFASLSLGQRDALLLGLREQTLGSTVRVFGQCPHCQESLEFTLSTDVLRGQPTAESAFEGEGSVHRQLDTANWRLEFRFPTGQDLVDASHCADVPAARRLLLERCVIRAWHGELPVDPQDLPQDVIAALGTQIVDLDPSAEILLALRCPLCEQAWQAPFDIGRFFWEEINALTKRLLLEVHTLARAYSWREIDILSMSAARRQFYLEMIC